ncbi:MAG: PaREP1 family protein [Vulcanisaeta sp.]
MGVLDILINEALRSDIDVVNVLTKALNLDPSERIEAHLELAMKFLNEGMGLIGKDPVQASEKLYRAAEEAVKVMAVALNLDEARTAMEQGRRTAALLFNAVDSISDRLSKEEVRLWWRATWFL